MSLVEESWRKRQYEESKNYLKWHKVGMINYLTEGNKLAFKEYISLFTDGEFSCEDIKIKYFEEIEKISNRLEVLVNGEMGKSPSFKGISIKDDKLYLVYINVQGSYYNEVIRRFLVFEIKTGKIIKEKNEKIFTNNEYNDYSFKVEKPHDYFDSWKTYFFNGFGMILKKAFQIKFDWFDFEPSDIELAISEYTHVKTIIYLLDFIEKHENLVKKSKSLHHFIQMFEVSMTSSFIKKWANDFYKKENCLIFEHKLNDIHYYDDLIIFYMTYFNGEEYIKPFKEFFLRFKFKGCHNYHNFLALFESKGDPERFLDWFYKSFVINGKSPEEFLKDISNAETISAETGFAFTISLDNRTTMKELSRLYNNANLLQHGYTKRDIYEFENTIDEDPLVAFKTLLSKPRNY